MLGDFKPTLHYEKKKDRSCRKSPRFGERSYRIFIVVSHIDA